MKTLTAEELRKVQLLELKILKEIKRICDKNRIRYFLTGGTLIGAVRHKGFIPWDDDIDIAMERDDYDRFCEIAPKELRSDFSFLNIKYDKMRCIFFSKVVLNGTNYRSIQQPRTLDKTGFAVDVIPYDAIYDNLFRAALYFWRLNFFVVLYSMKNGYHNGTTKLKHIVAVLMKFFFFFIPKSFLYKRICDYPYKLNRQSTRTKCYLCGRYGFPRELRSSFLFGEYTELEFEGEHFMVLKHYHEFLTELFGDYMQLPPENARVTHQVAELDFGKFADYTGES